MSNPSCPICRMAFPDHKMDCQNAYYVQALTAERDALREEVQELEASIYISETPQENGNE